MTTSQDATVTDSAAQAATLAAQYDLPKLGGRPQFRDYLAKLWQRRHFTVELARSRFRAQNEADRLGVLWAVLMPMINAAVYGLIFGFILTSTERPKEFVAFLVVGVFTFQFFASCMSDGAKSILNNRGLVRTLHFPRALLPIASVLQQLYSLAPMVAVMAIFSLLYNYAIGNGLALDAQWFLLLPALLLLIMFSMGVAFVMARLTIHIRDIAVLIPFMTRVLFYTSGVFLSIGRLLDSRAETMRESLGEVGTAVLGGILQGNPVHIYLTLVRDAILPLEPTEAAQPWMWVAATLWAVLLCTFGLWFTWRAEELYGRD